MKNLFITLLSIILFTYSSFSQQLEKNLSKSEEFSQKAGLLVERNFSDIGSVQGVQIQVMKVKDLISGTEFKSLRFEYVFKSSYSTDTKIAVLDSDEIEGLIKSLNFIKTNVHNSTRESYSEITFTSRTGFKAGCYWDNGKWKNFMKLEKFDSKSSVYFGQNEFNSLITYIEQASFIMK
jgi:hypothetical protein